MSNAITSYRDLVAWQKAMDLADLVYRITDTFPRSERFGLIFQMRKASVSIPSNIAEGHRHRLPGYIHRVTIALGEHAELETQALLSERRKFISKTLMAEFTALATPVGELTHGLLRSLEERLARQTESQIPTRPESRISNRTKSQLPNPAESQIPNPKSRRPL
jgi:four helix bundle protein